MAKNYSEDRMANRVPNTINQLMKENKRNRTDQITPNDYLPLPVLTSDPPVTKTGQFGLYFNSSTNKVRKSYSGSAWADTTI